MDIVAVAFALLGLTLFWGLGFALVALPPGLRKYSWLLAPTLGLSLQTFAVWIGVHLNFDGTNVYGFWALLIPAAFLGWALSRPPRRKAALAFFRNPRTASVAAVAIVGMVFVLSPMVRNGFGLTTFSIGNCDPPDYAEGARALQEFAYHSKIGFLGQPEVHGSILAPVGGFYGYWVRLNWFGPAAVIALDSTLLRLDGYRIISLVGILFFATAIPLAYVISRVWFRYRHTHAVFVAMAFAFTPLWYYAVYHGSLGQLIGSQGIILTLISGTWVQRGSTRLRSLLRHLPLAVLGLWLIVGSYPIMFFFAYGLLVLNCLAQSWLQKSWRRFFSWCGFTAAVFVLSIGLFPSRFLNIPVALSFYGNGALGWPIPRLNVAGLYGGVGQVGMDSASSLLSWTVGSLVLALLGLALVRGISRRDPALVPFAVCVPVILAGYYWLNHLEVVRQNLDSYKAYKLLAAFYPAVLAGLFYFLRFPLVRRLGYISTLILGLAAIYLGFRGSRYLRNEVARHPAYHVSPELAAVKKLESRSDIKSVNFMAGGVWDDDLWPRLWCSTFLMKKRQYFERSSYVSRDPTPLKGEWDLVQAPRDRFPVGIQRLTQWLYLKRHGESVPFSVDLAQGWWDYDYTSRWAGAAGKDFSLLVRADRPVQMEIKMIGRPAVSTAIFQAKLDGGPVSLKAREDGLDLPDLKLAPGEHRIIFTSDTMPVKLGVDDTRLVLYKLLDIQVAIHPASSE